MLGKKLKEAIKAAGYTQEEFAKLISTNRGLINQWITGKRNPSAPSLKKISKALKLPITFFLDNSVNTGNITAKDVNINSQNTVKMLEEKLKLKDEKIKILKERNDFLEDKIKFLESKKDKK